MVRNIIHLPHKQNKRFTGAGLDVLCFLFVCNSKGKYLSFCLLRQMYKVRSEAQFVCGNWKKIAYGIRARKNHTETGLKNPHRSLPAGFAGGSKTKHKNCRWEQEEI